MNERTCMGGVCVSAMRLSGSRPSGTRSSGFAAKSPGTAVFSLLVAALALLSFGARAGADTRGGASPPAEPPPCPPFTEIECGAPFTEGSMGPGLICPCGPGNWSLLPPQIKLDPELPLTIGEEIGKFTVTKSAFARGDKASAELKAAGRSGCLIGCDSSSVAESLRAAFSFAQTEVWQGNGPACPRLLVLNASGEATQAVAVSTTADQGCSSSSSSSISGMCSSLGDANAEITNGLTAKAQFNSASSKVSVSGNIGASVTIDSVSFQGSFSSQDQWETEGVGSAAGTASFTVKPNRDYCALTNKPVIRRAAGSVAMSGGASVAHGGASSFVASGSISMSIN